MTFEPSDEQRAIIEHPLEPLRVSAGAGTGKTTTVAHRIASIVERHGFEPEQVLGITFTNKAAEELADRVRQVLGDRLDPGRQVDVHTYHGFAAALLREFGVLVGVERDTGIVTPTFTRQMLSSIVRRVPLSNLNATWPGTIDRIRKLAAGMSDHLLDPADIPHGVGGPWPERLDLLRAVEIYVEEKRRLGVADYGDLIHFAHRLVSNHRWVADRIRSRYRAVVLDEYQDTNPGQRTLLAELFGDGFPVTAVGDPDQTIYEWRGASVGNFRRFPTHFPRRDGSSSVTLPLSLNRRSGTAILTLANEVRARVDPEPREPLTPVDGAGPGKVRAGWFEDAVSEAEWIADEVVRMHEAGTPWRAFAVLFRKNKDMALVRDALAALDVPTEVANLGGLLSVPEVVELHAWLRLLHSPGDGPALARLLMGSRHRLGMGDLAVLARWARLHHPVEEDDDIPPWSMMEAIEHVDDLALRSEAKERVALFGKRYRELLVAAQGSTLVELCRQILDATGAWRDVEAMSEARRLSARLNLYRFLDLAEQWSPLEGRPSLEAFLDYLQTMDEEPAEELDTARLAGADAVTLVTVHRAKGLEWPVVFIPGLYEGNFPSRVMGAYDNPFTKAESIPHELRLDAEDLPPISHTMDEKEATSHLRARHDSQEWRIAYVACTRAKDCITFTGAHWYGSPEPTKRPSTRSGLYRLVEAFPDVEIVHDSQVPPTRPDTMGFRTDRGAAPDPLFDLGWQDALRTALTDSDRPALIAGELGVTDAYDAAVRGHQELLFSFPEEQRQSETTASFTSSVTGLVTYAACPKRYFWAEVDRLPRRHNPAARRGVDVHRRIELHHKGVVPLEELDPSFYDVTPADRFPDGPTAASAFDNFAASRFAAQRPFLVEAPFELRLAADVTVRGRIDAVYVSGSAWEVVDFKSGRPSNDPANRVQLEAYALAVRDGAFAGPPRSQLSVTFAFLGGGLVERTEAVDDTWMEQAERHLSQLAGSIRRSEFEPKPSNACTNCDFLGFCQPGRAFVDVNSARRRDDLT